MLKYKNLFINKKNIKFYEENCSKKYFTKRKLSILEINNGIILPAKEDNSNKKMWAIGGVIDCNKKFVKESASRYLFGGNYEVLDEDIKTIDEEVIYFGPYISHWGHFICDQISRLWFALKSDKKYRIAYCGWDWGAGKSDKINDNFLQLIELLDINPNRLINITRPIKFKKIIIPDFSFIVGEYYTREFIQLLDKIIENALKKGKQLNLSKYEKIYFTRQNFSDSSEKEYGEKNLVELFQKNDFKILSPEKLSAVEQIFYINNAKYIASLSGSITHNYMFNKNSNLNVIVLNKINLCNDYQMMIDHISMAKITYIDVYRYVRPVLFGTGPFIVEKTKFLHQYIKLNKLNDIHQKNDLLKKYRWFFKKYKIIYSNEKYRKLLNMK
jgi:hypothetical protein